MIALFLLGSLVCASAAPWYNQHHRRPSQYNYGDDYLDRFFESQVFDTRGFWNELNREMMRLDSLLADLHHRFPYNDPTIHVDDKEYRITLTLPGFNEQEVIVKAKKGLLVVQAIHKADDKPDMNVLVVRSLPNNVGENGSWTYENGLLTIIFPKTNVVSEPPTQTVAPEHSREEMENTGETKDFNENIDEMKGDSNADNLLTNEIPHHEEAAEVEATTYAVGLSDDVELLPMRRY